MAETHPQPTGSQLGEIRRAGAQMKPVPHLVHFAQRLRVAMADQWGVLLPGDRVAGPACPPHNLRRMR
jgi:hypothetical protein